MARHLIATYGDVTLDDDAAAAPQASEAQRRRAQQRQHHEQQEELLSFEDGRHECRSYTMLAIAEHLKKQLSSAEAASFSCRRRRRQRRREGASPDQEQGEEIVALTTTREAFETTACGDVFARALAPVDRVLESNGMKHGEIDEVVMVGGAYRITCSKLQVLAALPWMDL